MSLTKTIKKIKEDLEITVLDMENLHRQGLHYIHRERDWIKGIRKSISDLDSILNHNKNNKKPKKKKGTK